MERIFKVAIDPLPVASPDVSEIEVEMELGDPAKPECSRAEFWYEFDQSGHGIMRCTVSEPSEPSTVSELSTASSAWSTGSFHSVSELSAGPSSPYSKWVVRIRKGHGAKRTTRAVVAAIKNEETIGPQKVETMPGVQRVAEPLSVNHNPDGRPPSKSEMRVLQVAEGPGDEFRIAPAPHPPPGSDSFDLRTMDGALPHYALGFSSRHVYDFTEMNDALSGHPSHSSSRRSFNPMETSGSRTQAKVRQIREEGRHQHKN